MSIYPAQLLVKVSKHFPQQMWRKTQATYGLRKYHFQHYNVCSCLCLNRQTHCLAIDLQFLIQCCSSYDNSKWDYGCLKSPSRSNGDGSCLTRFCRSVHPNIWSYTDSSKYVQHIVIFSGCSKLIANACRDITSRICVAKQRSPKSDVWYNITSGLIPSH